MPFDGTSEREALLRLRSTRPSSLHRYTIGRFLILASQCLERTAFYGLVANFVFFLNGDPYAWTSYNAVSIVFVFNCVCFFFSFFAALLAEKRLGKYKVILLGYVFYLLFYLPLPFLYFDTWNHKPQSNISALCIVRRASRHRESARRSIFNERCVAVVLFCMCMVGTGAAFIKAVVTPFGADQFPMSDPAAMRSFFNWYYWCVNAGTFAAYVVLAFVQVNFSIFWGYLAPYLMLVTSAVLFALCHRFTRITPPSGKGLGAVFKVLCLATSTGCRGPKAVGGTRLLSQESVSDASLSVPEAVTCLDRCSERYGGPFHAKEVDNTRRLLKMVCVFLSFIFYWACYYQIESTFLSQGLHMRVLGLSGDPVPKETFYHLPASCISVFDIVTILLLIPVLDTWVYPFLFRHNIMPPLYLRMAIGMVCSMAAMIVAGFVERKRMAVFWGVNNTSPYYPRGAINQTIGQTKYFAADMTFFYQIPQYALVGLGEAFTNVAGLEFAYTHAPSELQAVVTGLYWLFAGLGSLLGMGVVQAVSSAGLLFSNDRYDINYRKPCVYPNGTRIHPFKTCAKTHLDYYFFILAGLQLFGLLLLLLTASCIGLAAVGTVPMRRGRQTGRGRDGERPQEGVLASEDSIVNSYLRESDTDEPEVLQRRDLRRTETRRCTATVP